jgi:hypothetical protein
MFVAKIRRVEFMPCKIISKKDRQHNGQKKKNNNDKQNITQNTKDRATRTPLQTVGEVRCSGRVGSSCSTWWAKFNIVTKILHQPAIIRNVK